MDQYSEKHFVQNHSKTAIANNQNGKNAIQLMDNRPISALQQKLSTIQKKSNPVQLQTVTPTKNNSTIQLVRSRQTTGRKNNKKTAAKKIKATEKNVYSPNLQYYDNKISVSRKANAVKSYLEIVKLQLEDDEEISLLKSYETKVNEIQSETKAIYRNIISLPPPRGYLRSQNVERNKLANQLIAQEKYLNIVISEIKKVFPMNAGGFGAKGRAHDIDTDVNPTSAPFGKTLNNHYFSNFWLDGIASDINVYKQSDIAPQQKKGPLQILGSPYANNSNISKIILLNQINNLLPSIQAPQKITFTNTPVGKDRGDGQYKNMANTNAAGYAWLLGLVGNQRWEWLHIRGAGLGGTTDSTNLVAGVRDANTHMIPFESNIRHLGTAVKKHSDKYSKLEVIWSVSGQIATHAYETIRISWGLFRHNGTLKATGDISFQPLNTSNNISKNEVAKIENLLTEVRNGLDE